MVMTKCVREFGLFCVRSLFFQCLCLCPLFWYLVFGVCGVCVCVCRVYCVLFCGSVEMIVFYGERDSVISLTLEVNRGSYFFGST